MQRWQVQHKSKHTATRVCLEGCNTLSLLGLTMQGHHYHFNQAVHVFAYLPHCSAAPRPTTRMERNALIQGLPCGALLFFAASRTNLALSQSCWQRLPTLPSQSIVIRKGRSRAPGSYCCVCLQQLDTQRSPNAKKSSAPERVLTWAST